MTHHHSNQLVQKLWNYCNVLRDGGLSYGDYVEQLTFLLFLKMADEQSQPPHNRPSAVPKGFGCDILITLDGDDLETHYRHTLEELGKRPGMLGVIFRKAQNKIQDPACSPAAPSGRWSATVASSSSPPGGASSGTSTASPRGSPTNSRKAPSTGCGGSSNACRGNEVAIADPAATGHTVCRSPSSVIHYDP